MKVHALLAVAGTAHAFSGITGRHLPASTVGGLSRTCLPRSPALSMQVQKAQTSIFVDEEAMRQEKAFPLTPEDMIARSKAFLESRGGFGADPDLIADDFQFMGPVVSHVTLAAARTPRDLRKRAARGVQRSRCPLLRMI